MMKRPKHSWTAPLIVGAGSAIALFAIEWIFRLLRRDELPGGYLLQEWPSDIMMQTIELSKMVSAGPISLWLNHVYPPLQDAFRYAFTIPFLVTGRVPDPVVVDHQLYALYAICFGLVNAVVYLWVRDLTKSGYWALVVTLLWAISPGYLSNMMLLESTPLAMAALAVAYYLLYRFLRTRRLVYATGFLLATLIASLTRNITQMHVLIVLIVFIVASWAMARERSRLLLLANTGLLLLMLVLPLKQFVLFGTFDTSSFSGIHRVGMLWIPPSSVPDSPLPDRIQQNASRMESKNNTVSAALENVRLSDAATRAWASDPIGSVQSMARSLTITVPELLRPSSEYTNNRLVNELPWRAPYDWLFSGWRYLAVLALSIGIVVVDSGLHRSWQRLRRYAWFAVFYALVLAPVLWSNRYHPGHEDLGPIWTDAMRLKMFVEVPLVVLMGFALWCVPGLFRRARSRKRRIA